MDQATPNADDIREAAMELREGTPRSMSPGDPDDWRGRVADWLDRQAEQMATGRAWTPNRAEQPPSSVSVTQHVGDVAPGSTVIGYRG